jgi:hypothetical protein
MTISLEPNSLRIIVHISMRILPVGTSSHIRKISRACSHRLSATKTHAFVLAHTIARSAHHHSLLMTQPYGRTIHCPTAGSDLERP